LALSDLADDARFDTSPKRVANRDAMRALLGAVFRTRSAEHWLAELRKVDVLCTRVATYQDVVAHPQVAASGMIAGMDHPDFGTVRVPGFPINTRETNAEPHMPAPAPGQHSAAILSSFGYSPRDIADLIDRKAVFGTAPETVSITG
jgi:crotonobetainyl-CoA:carnitine CoA-transferase CaiB-like acyl-CoA transferase